MKKKKSFLKSILDFSKKSKAKKIPAYRSRTVKIKKPVSEKKKLGILRKLGRLRKAAASPPLKEGALHTTPVLRGIRERQEVFSRSEQGIKVAKRCEKISKYAIYVLVFLMPLFFLPWTANVLDFNKQALLMVLVFISFFCLMLKTLALGRITFNLTNFHILILVFLVIAGASTFFSLWRYGSFWGWPLITSESLFTLIFLVLFYFLLVNTFSKKEVFNLTALVVISGFLAVLFGILQLFGKFILPWDFAKTVSFNTVGSMNRLGIFSAVLIPLAVGLLMVSKKGILKTIAVIFLILTVILLILLNFSTIWWVVVGAAALLMAFGMQRSALFDNRFLMLPMFFLALALLFIFFRFQIPGLPVRSIEVFLTHEISTDIAVETIKERPILGSGPGTFIYDFSKHKNIEFNKNPFWNMRFDAARSKILGMLATLGILGVLGFLGMIGFFLFYGVKYLFGDVRDVRDIREVRGVRDVKDEGSWVLASSIFASFAVLSFSFFLYNSNLTLDFLFFFLAGVFMAFKSPIVKNFELKPSSFLTLGTTFAFTVVFIFGLGLFILEGQRYMAEVNYLKGVKAWQTGSNDAALNYLERSAKLNPKTDLFWRELSQIYLRKINEETARKDISQEEINKRVQFLINNTVNASKAATDINERSAANWSVRGFVYQNLIGVVGGVSEWTKTSYNEALALEPASPYYPTQIGIALLKEATFMPRENTSEKQKNYNEAIMQFEKAIELKSDYAPARFQMAMAFQSQGKTDEAIVQMQRAKTLAPFDVGLAFQLGLIFYQNRNYRSAAAELERAVSINPNYSNALYFLGLSYDKLGQRTKAIEKFERLSGLNPGNYQIRTILNNLRQGENALKGIIEQMPPEIPIEEENPDIDEE